ncbi:MAG: hypothetical protein AVO33_01610 [delta proteobacterium ML8_F1]|nr:MAG: hypothetical protein AVO33_01610 [delta proteobacterium ML8_F1]
MTGFARDLLEWYDVHHRPLPFRESQNPYKVWISEVMAQQTQMDTVIGYYERFIRRFPRISSLAQASEEEVLKLWEGLGYYSRGRNLLKAAKRLHEDYGDRFPESYEELIKLPGIGDYTAGAILSIAFDQKICAVDGNVQRVISRYEALPLDISDGRTKKLFKERVLEKMTHRPGDFNQALMELGALVCTPKNPSCDKCPLQAGCRASLENRVAEFPVKTRGVKIKKEKIAFACLKEGEKFLMVKGDPKGLLPGLWGFPYAVVTDFEEGLEALERYLLEDFGFSMEGTERLSEATHVFTHRKWEMKLLKVDGEFTRVMENPRQAWVDTKTLETLPVSRAIQKLLGGI